MFQLSREKIHLKEQEDFSLTKFKTMRERALAKGYIPPMILVKVIQLIIHKNRLFHILCNLKTM
jgi:hypothetical protein